MSIIQNNSLGTTIQNLDIKTIEIIRCELRKVDNASEKFESFINICFVELLIV